MPVTHIWDQGYHIGAGLPKIGLFKNFHGEVFVARPGKPQCGHLHFAQTKARFPAIEVDGIVFEGTLVVVVRLVQIPASVYRDGKGKT